MFLRHAAEQVSPACLCLDTRGGQKLTCPTCGRLAIDLEAIIAQLEQRLATVVDVMHRIDAKIDVIMGHRHGTARPEAAGSGDREQGEAGYEP